MNNWTLDYNGCISLILIPEEGDTLSYSSFYKLSLRRYIAEYANGVFRGKASLTYLDYKKIIELCNQECKKRGVELCVRRFTQVYSPAGKSFGDTFQVGR